MDDEPKELKQAKVLLKKASDELNAKNSEIENLKSESDKKDKLISELTAKQTELSKEHVAVNEELKQIKQDARDEVLKKQIESEEKLGILDVSKEDRLKDLRELDEKGGFDLYAKQTMKMMELHKGVGDRKTLVNNSNQTKDAKQEIANALGMEAE